MHPADDEAPKIDDEIKDLVERRTTETRTR